MLAGRAAGWIFKPLRAGGSVAGHDGIFRRMELCGRAEFAVMEAAPCCVAATGSHVAGAVR